MTETKIHLKKMQTFYHSGQKEDYMFIDIRLTELTFNVEV